jgi:hypothetical protein
MRNIRFVLHDRDTKFCYSFRAILTSGEVQPLHCRHAVRISMHVQNDG